MRRNTIKYTLKIALLVFVACVSLKIIYGKVTDVKEIDRSEDLLLIQNKAEEEFLKDSNYTFKNPKVILNPYKISPLTALIIFETNDSSSITLTVKGKDENTDITTTFSPAKNHIIPVYGLYPNKNNEVIIKNGDKEKTIYIKTDKLPDELVKPTSIYSNKKELNNDLYFVTPASNGYTAAYDVNGDVRWYLTDKFIWDIKRLDNGNLLLSSNRVLEQPYYMVGLVEMNLLGKIYHEYVLPGGYHHDVFEKDDGNLIVATDNFEKGTVEDYVVEINRKNGKIVKEIDLKKILPMDKGGNVYATDYDWFHNNAVWYDKKTDSLTLSGRHKDAVVNINYKTNEINWIIGSKDKWPKKYHKYFFEADASVEWQWAQHAAMILPNGNVFIFDNGNNRSKTKEKVKAENNYSRGVIYKIDNQKKRIIQVWQYGKELGNKFYSPYISDVDYIDDNHYIVHSGGIAEKDGKSLNNAAGITGADKLKSTTVELKNDEIVFKMDLPTNTYRVEKLDLYVDNEFKTGKGTTIGKFNKTETTKNRSILFFSKKIDKEYKKHKITLYQEKDRMVINGIFKKSDKVQIILDKVFDKKTYDMKISKKPYTALCVDLFTKKEEKEGINITKYINNEGLSGRYYIYIRINGTNYNTNKYIQF